MRTQDPQAAAHTYTQTLGWPIAVGHRYRPRAGCTCQNPTCPTPGAHPRPGTRHTDIGQELRETPSASIICQTICFDALVMPHPVAMAAMVRLEAEAPVPVPCLYLPSRHAALLVLPGTGTAALSARSQPVVAVRTGPDDWVPLPPSHDVRWDTPPWAEPTGGPVQLLPGGELRTHLSRSCLRNPSQGRA
ncbi:hypothetical protein GCM10010387_57520 [Streptomyces inusitatus]|uniref:DNA primase n=1 Tax=Streptomyces inusitatus TaxID=68221 RepID=A0A918V130_9ACTN|nr:hypothetical protein GCM10010387_57520 [Streptomyces inusitatus]